jgi:hypothetical protein
MKNQLSMLLLSALIHPSPNSSTKKKRDSSSSSIGQSTESAPVTFTQPHYILQGIKETAEKVSFWEDQHGTLFFRRCVTIIIKNSQLSKPAFVPFCPLSLPFFSWRNMEQPFVCSPCPL